MENAGIGTEANTLPSRKTRTGYTYVVVAKDRALHEYGSKRELVAALQVPGALDNVEKVYKTVGEVKLKTKTEVKVDFDL